MPQFRKAYEMPKCCVMVFFDVHINPVAETGGVATACRLLTPPMCLKKYNFKSLKKLEKTNGPKV